MLMVLTLTDMPVKIVLTTMWEGGKIHCHDFQGILDLDWHLSNEPTNKLLILKLCPNNTELVERTCHKYLSSNRFLLVSSSTAITVLWNGVTKVGLTKNKAMVNPHGNALVILLDKKPWACMNDRWYVGVGDGAGRPPEDSHFLRWRHTGGERNHSHPFGVGSRVPMVGSAVV